MGMCHGHFYAEEVEGSLVAVSLVKEDCVV